MAYTGQPVPTRVHDGGAAKISDGKSVRVSVPANSGDITAGSFAYFGGFLGVAMQSLKDSATAAQDLILQIEVAEYETNQIDATQDFAAGTKIYWNDTTKKFTETQTSVFAGVVTNGKDANNVIWFVLMPGIINDQAADAIGELTDLQTTEKDSVVAAINEVNTNADAANTAIGTLTELATSAQASVVAAINEVAGRVAANVACAADADTEAVRSALIALLAALEAAGLMATGDGA